MLRLFYTDNRIGIQLTKYVAACGTNADCMHVSNVKLLSHKAKISITYVPHETAV